MPANRERGELALGPYVLKLTTNAAVVIETATKRDWLDIVAGAARLNMTDRCLFLWAVLLHHQPDMTLERAGEIHDEVGWTNASNAINDLLALNAEGAPQGDPLKAQAGTGAGSTSKPAATA